MHSEQELINAIKKNKQAPDDIKIIVISLSPQSVASLSGKYNISPIDCMRKLEWFFKVHLMDKYGLGRSSNRLFLADTSFSREFSLIESAREFCGRKWRDDSNDSSISLPLLASSCPGWICYAEKTHGNFILPYISTTKSPQQIMGCLVKLYFPQIYAQIFNCEPIGPSDIFHVSIMPCPDKKLEATRPDFLIDPVEKSTEVDLVLSTSELDRLISSEGFSHLGTTPSIGYSPIFGKSCPTMESYSLSILESWNSEHDFLIGTDGDSSGGYLDFIINYVADLKYKDYEDKKIITLPGKNQDSEDVILVVDGEIKLKFGRCFGFKNIQNMVRSLKRAKNGEKPSSVRIKRRAPRVANPNDTEILSEQKSFIKEWKNKSMDKKYDFIEVMACPSGCINGGGQLKPALHSQGIDDDSELGPGNIHEEMKKYTSHIENIYQKVSPKRSPLENPKIDFLYNDWLGGADSKLVKKYLHTQYHAVEEEVAPLAVQW